MMEKLAANRFRPAMPYGTNPHNKVLVSTQKQPLWDPLRKPQRPSKDVHRLSLRNQYSPKLSDMIPPPVNNGNKLPATDTFTSSASRGGPLKRLKPKRIFKRADFCDGALPVRDARRQLPVQGRGVGGESPMVSRSFLVLDQALDPRLLQWGARFTFLR